MSESAILAEGCGHLRKAGWEEDVKACACNNSKGCCVDARISEKRKWRESLGSKRSGGYDGSGTPVCL